MTDDRIVKARLSGTNIRRLADAIAAADGWYVIKCDGPYPNKREPGERVYLTVLHDCPPAGQIHAWLSANGWEKLTFGPAGAFWAKGPAEVAMLHAEPVAGIEQRFVRDALNRIAAAEGIATGELVAAIMKAAST